LANLKNKIIVKGSAGFLGRFVVEVLEKTIKLYMKNVKS